MANLSEGRNFGAALRKERESRGIALETVVGATKISVRHLNYLEEERFDQLPGGVFNKGMVRSYTRMLGLDEEEWITKYLAASKQNDAFNEDDLNWTAFAENVGKSRGKSRRGSERMMRWAGVFVLLLFLCGLSWFVWQYIHHKSEAGARTSQSQSLAMKE
jgi:cytoskeleton protein RodZ